MRTFYRSFTRLTAAALIVAMSAAPGLAAKTTPATDKNTNVPAVPRAIPDLVPYGKFDPPKGVFDPSKLTISGDMRVRPEFRTNGNFSNNGDSNAYFTQQLIRLGFNYDVSPDVVFFLQPQVSNNFGAMPNPDNVGGAGNPNSPNADLFLRQGFMLVRNFLMPNLTLKAGRQLMVWGNHRIFGHFDWNNVGFSFDGVTMRYNHATVPVELGWLRVAEGNCVQNAGGCTTGKASKGDGDILFLRLPMKFGSVAVEPAYIYEDGGATTGAGSPAFGTGGQQSNQERSTVGGRVAFKEGMFDLTGEGYWQFGEIGPVGGASQTRINALAGHLDGGITLPVPMQPRIGAEINYATGSSNKDGGHTFSQLFPTNHIHFGYMDLMSWQNMLTYGGNLQLRPTPESHFEIAGHIMRLANKRDNWYTASQATFFSTPAGNDEKSLGGEIDVVYTLFFQNNRVGWQLGYGHFFTGDYLKKNGFGTADQNWGYTQLWINF
ncbi:alginate export family protein [Nitrospira sp. T9]|uniref:alginate export family protein n=1 Tax=unclassified Nitrospira TaxID=2652172 RepID=UPI003F9B1B3C